jgi:hypothetical protein
MRAVNLIPADQRGGAGRGMGRSGGGAYVVLGFLGALALLLLLYGRAHHQVTSRKAQAAALNAKAQQAQEAVTRLAPYTTFLALREQREQAVSQLVDARFDWAHIFHELGRVLPVQTSITSLTGGVGPASGAASGSSGASGAASSSPSSTSSTSSSPSSSAASTGGAVASATPPGSVPTVTLAGCATSQSVVAVALNRLRLIDGVSEVTLQSSTKSTLASAASGPSGGCGRGPAFTTVLTFQPLPSVDTARAAAVARNVSSGGAR